MNISFSDLKSRASKAKDATVSKFSDTKDRYSSQSSKNLDIPDPQRQRSIPPPPPSRAKSTDAPPPPGAPIPFAASFNSNAPPPPISRSTRPDATSSPSPTSVPLPPQRPTPPVRRTGTGPRDIDWANLSAEDKRIFFSWLDEFFAGYFSKTPGSLNNNQRSPVNPASGNAIQSSELSSTGSIQARVEPPPKIALWSKPQQSLNESKTSSVLSMTYPPESKYGSTSLDIAHYFQPSTHWDSAWYSANPPVAPPIVTVGDPWQMASQTGGGQHEVFYGVICRDLSVCWCSVAYSTTRSSDPNRVRRSARYLPRPKPLDRQTLIEAHETYGETVASFAEGYVESRQYCARGECWDLAAEALRCFEQYDYVPKPIPSLGHTHGHLIAWFRVENRKRAGRWRGGDDRVRRGDIVQWKSVKIVSKLPGGGIRTAMLGAPDHTSIVVQDTIPSKSPLDGESFLPEDLGSLEVAKQSVSTSQLPTREQYDLGGLDTGEIWIYRPIGFKTYLGTEFCARCPDDVDALTL